METIGARLRCQVTRPSIHLIISNLATLAHWLQHFSQPASGLTKTSSSRPSQCSPRRSLQKPQSLPHGLGKKTQTLTSSGSCSLFLGWFLSPLHQVETCSTPRWSSWGCARWSFLGRHGICPGSWIFQVSATRENPRLEEEEIRSGLGGYNDWSWECACHQHIQRCMVVSMKLQWFVPINWASAVVAIWHQTLPPRNSPGVSGVEAIRSLGWVFWRLCNGQQARRDVGCTWLQ